MNTKNMMILVKGEIKTKDISSCQYNPNTKKWDVIFYGNNKVFSYVYTHVEKINEVETFKEYSVLRN